VSFAAITLCVASQRVVIVVSVYFVIDSVRKLSVTPSYGIMTSQDTCCATTVRFLELIAVPRSTELSFQFVPGVMNNAGT